jgi:phosphoglycolate phosphatase
VTPSVVMKAVLFDIDGTLMLGYGAGTRAMTRAGRSICGEAFDLAGIMIGGGLDPIIYHQAATSMGLVDPHLLHDAFRDRYLEELKAELIAAERRAHVLPGVASLLTELGHYADVAVGLVTGNYQLAVPIKFDHVGLPAHGFIAGGFGDDAPTRPGLVPVALARMQSALGIVIDPKDVIVVGDTPRDVDCALQNGCRCLAVATGAHGVEELRAAGAQRVVRDLYDPEPLLSWL